MKDQNVFDFITTEEANYKAVPVNVAEGWDWSMAKHVQTTIFYKNGRLLTGNTDDKPVKNITRPILNLQYRATGFDVKDIKLFVDDRDDYYKSFLVRKFHEKWARENNMDTFIDNTVESYVDFGGALVKNVNQVRPEVVPLQRLAFCDQTDILSGPICEKHFYSPDQLMEMAKNGWGDEKKGATSTLQEVITLSQELKKNKNSANSKTPGKYIEVYELHGMFPKWWLDNSYEAPAGDYAKEYTRQIHIICFYSKENSTKGGLCLFKGKEKELPYKLVLRDEIYGRALGMGGAEELFEPQVWVNYDVIRMTGLLDAAAKIIYQTADQKYATRNKTANLENGEILIHEEGHPLTQIQTTPVNISLFERSVSEWEDHARQMGSATGALLGENTGAARQSYNSIALVTSQGQAIHDYRKGKLATFIGEVYRDWIIPYIAQELSKGQEFLSELDLEELQQVADNLVICETNKVVLEKILNGETIDGTQIDTYKQQVRDSFMKGGNKKFIEILKGELAEIPVDVEVSINGKQKDLTARAEILTKIFGQVIASVNPATGQSMLDDPKMAKLFNEILEANGISPLDFYSPPKPVQPAQPQPVLQQPAQVGAGQLASQMGQMGQRVPQMAGQMLGK